MSEFGPSPRLALTQKELKIGIGWARDVIRRLDLILDPECVNKWIASRSSSKLQSRDGAAFDHGEALTSPKRLPEAGYALFCHPSARVGAFDRTLKVRFEVSRSRRDDGLAAAP